MLGGVAQKNVLISFCTHRCINVQNQSYLITLTIAHLKIALLGGNSEVGNSEYINHQNCPPQLLCIFSVNMAIG